MTMDSQTIATAFETLSPPMKIGDDLRELRERLAAVTDRVMVDIQRQGLDLDGCVLHRRAEMRRHGSDNLRIVPIESLTNPATLVKPFIQKQLKGDSSGQSHAAIEITAVFVDAILAPDFPDNTAVDRVKWDARNNSDE